MVGSDALSVTGTGILGVHAADDWTVLLTELAGVSASEPRLEIANGHHAAEEPAGGDAPSRRQTKGRAVPPPLMVLLVPMDGISAKFKQYP